MIKKIMGIRLINCKAIDRICDNSGKTIGYLMIDNKGMQIRMKSDEIKKLILAKKLYPGNLRLTSDNKFIHEPENDKYGLDVSPVVFFSGKHGNWVIGCDGQMVRVTSDRYNVQCHFSMNLYNNHALWLLRQACTDSILLSKDYTDVAT